MREIRLQANNRAELPVEAVFPESIGLDPSTGDAYLGSLADGTLYQLAFDGDVEVWSPGGVDDRKSVAGVKVDSSGRLWAAGGYEGTLHVYDLASRSLVAHMDVGGRPSCVNDIAFGPDGTAYVTDSLISLLFRVDADSLTLRPWVDLAEQGVPWAEGLNSNGIVLTRDGKHLVACQTNTVTGALRSDDFAFPTSVAIRDGDLLVVNAQLDKMGGAPELPFTVAILHTHNRISACEVD